MFIIDMCYGVGVGGLLLGFCGLIFPWFRGFVGWYNIAFWLCRLLSSLWIV